MARSNRQLWVILVASIALVGALGIGGVWTVRWALDGRTVFADIRSAHASLPILDRYEEVDGSEVLDGDGDCSWGPSCGSPPPSVRRTYVVRRGAAPLGCDALRDRLAEWSDGDAPDVESTEPCTISGYREPVGYASIWQVVVRDDGSLVVTIGG